VTKHKAAVRSMGSCAGYSHGSSRVASCRSQLPPCAAVPLTLS